MKQMSEKDRDELDQFMTFQGSNLAKMKDLACLYPRYHPYRAHLIQGQLFTDFFTILTFFSQPKNICVLFHFNFI